MHFRLQPIPFDQPHAVGVGVELNRGHGFVEHPLRFDRVAGAQESPGQSQARANEIHLMSGFDHHRHRLARQSHCLLVMSQAAHHLAIQPTERDPRRRRSGAPVDDVRDRFFEHRARVFDFAKAVEADREYCARRRPGCGLIALMLAMVRDHAQCIVVGGAEVAIERIEQTQHAQKPRVAVAVRVASALEGLACLFQVADRSWDVAIRLRDFGFSA